MGQLAFLFPGQGSQTVGMLADLYDSHGLVRNTFSEASEVLGYDLWDLIRRDPDDQLNKTEFTQPALLACSIAIWQVWQDQHGLEPQILAGHSLGEYSALVASSVLEFQAAIGLVQKRGRYMQEAVPVGRGGMAAVLGLDDEQVVQICDSVSNGGVVQAANFNSPGQVVIAGDNSAVEQAIIQCQQAGAKRAMSLPVSAPFHCRLMQPAANNMNAELDNTTFSKPQIPVIQNVTADFAADPARIRDNLKAQICNPVRWTETVQRLAAEKCDRLVECGPGKVLSGLARRIERGVQTLALSDQTTLSEALSDLGG